MAGNFTHMTITMHPSLSMHRIIFLYIECLFLILAARYSGYFKLKLPILRRYPQQCEDFLTSFLVAYLFSRSVALSLLSSLSSSSIKLKIILGFVFLPLSPSPDVFFSSSWCAADRMVWRALELAGRWVAELTAPGTAESTALAIRGPTALSEWLGADLGLEIFLAWLAAQAVPSTLLNCRLSIRTILESFYAKFIHFCMIKSPNDGRMA